MPEDASTALRLVRVDARPRYRALDLPAHLALAARASAIRAPRRRRRALRLANRWLLPLAARWRPDAAGTLQLDVAGAPRRARFRAANPTFSWQYLAPWAGNAEIETIALLERLVGARDTFFDVGANWGYFAHALAARPGFAGIVHAFEPHPLTCADLVSLARQFGVEGALHVHRLALSDRDGRARFDAGHRNDPGTARLAAHGALEVRAATLDGLGLPAPTAIKLDVEGHEASVLRGAARCLDTARPFVVLESWPGEAGAADALAELARRDYDCFLPAWAIGPGDGLRLSSDTVRARGPDGFATLALLPIDPRARDLFAAAQPNLLACPRERLDDLDRRLAGDALSAPRASSGAAGKSP